MTSMLSLSQQYILASRARTKLMAAADKSSGKDHDLRVLVGHANLLDRLSDSVAKFDEIVARRTVQDDYDDEDFSDSDSDSENEYEEEEQELDVRPEQAHGIAPDLEAPRYTHIQYSYSKDTESNSESDSDLTSDSDSSSSSDAESDYDESDVRSKYIANMQDLQEDLDSEYSLSAGPALYKCPSQNLTLSAASLSKRDASPSAALGDERLLQAHITTMLLSDEESDDDLLHQAEKQEEDLGTTMTPVYVL